MDAGSAESTLGAIEEFYNRAHWPAVLRRYADVDHSDADVDGGGVSPR